MRFPSGDRSLPALVVFAREMKPSADSVMLCNIEAAVGWLGFCNIGGAAAARTAMNKSAAKVKDEENMMDA